MLTFRTLLAFIYLSCVNTFAQQITPPPATDPVDQPEQAVAVEPVARDDAIAKRIREIMMTTGWYKDVKVRVDEGVVFLDGLSGTEDQRVWARNLANKTQDVVAVVNRIQVDPTPHWSFRPAYNELKRLVYRFVGVLPLIILAIIILPLAWLLAKLVYRMMNGFLARRIDSPLLTDIVAKVIATPALLIGLYVVLQVAGLTSIALSLLGGAGVIGIVLGFAFRDIAENFLASLLLSIRRPFRAGDLIEVAEQTGIVQNMNTRTTILLSPEGNHIQIPNATVFKSIINNYSASDARRNVLSIGIGYDAPVSIAQSLLIEIVGSHEAVQKDPPPLALVDTLGAATVNLKVYYWYNGAQYDKLKVQSALLRLIKRKLTDAGISMPDDAREVIFPQGVPVIQANSEPQPSAVSSAQPEQTPQHSEQDEQSVTPAEGDLANERKDIESQSANADLPESQQNLLKD